MRNRYRLTFTFTDTEEEARAICDRYTATATPYARKKHPAFYRAWTSSDGREHKFIAWTYTN